MGRLLQTDRAWFAMEFALGYPDDFARCYDVRQVTDLINESLIIGIDVQPILGYGKMMQIPVTRQEIQHAVQIHHVLIGDLSLMPGQGPGSCHSPGASSPLTSDFYSTIDASMRTCAETIGFM